MFQEATMEMTSGAFQSESEADKRLLAMFNYHPHPDQAASLEAGRPIFKDREYVMIMVPGDKESIVHRPAMQRDIDRFPKQYAAFKNKQAEADSGTPLGLLTWMNASQVKELEYFNVRTVEHLASVTENLAPKFPGLLGLKKRANDFLLAAAGQAPLVKMQAELEQRDSTIEALQRQVSELAAKFEKAPKEK